MSSHLNLTPLEVKDLIRKYKSELRKLHFQSQKIQSIISELEASMPEADPVIATVQMTTAEGEVQPTVAETPQEKQPEKAPAPAKTEAAPSKQKTKSKSPGKNGVSKSAKAAKGKRTRNTKLNEWDNFVIEAIKGAEKPLINAELIDQGKEKITQEQLDMDEEKLKTKLNQTLHKLANKKALLTKVRFSGRGYAYALSDWMTNKGELPKKYQR